MTPPTPALAALVTPGLFAAGAVATAIPIIIHLLAKRRFKRIRWAAVEFLLHAEKENRRKINLRQLILLALRCLAVILIGLLLARPFVSPGTLLGALGTAGDTVRLVILDDSFSMNYRHGASSTFDRARSDLLDLLEDLHRQDRGDRITMMLTSQPDDPLVQSVRLAELNLREFQTRLEARQPSALTADMTAILRAQADRLRANPDATQVTVYVFSDLQQRDWLPRAAADDRGSSPLEAFADWPEGRALSLILMPAVASARPNLAVTAVRTAPRRMVGGIENTIYARVTNQSATAAPAGRLNVYLQDAALPDVQVPAIPPGGSLEVGFDVLFPTAGPHSLRVQIAPDALPTDNQRLATYDVQGAIRVLLVNGEPSTNRLEDEIAMLRTALRPEGETFSGFEITVIGESELVAATLDRYHAIMLANVYRVDRETTERLQQFVTEGGGLAIFLGDQIDAEWYNERLYQNGGGLLPCQIGPRIRIEPGRPPSTLEAADRGHPLAGAFDGLMTDVAFWAYHDCVMPSEGDPAAVAPVMIARFVDGRDRPAVAERKYGRGRVLLVTSTADLEWNNWAKWPSFVVVMQELGQYLAAAGIARPETIAGQPLGLTLDADIYQSDVRVRPPDYPASPEVPTQAQPTADGTAYELTWTRTERPGIYRFAVSTTAGEPSVIERSVNVDPTESRLNHCSEEDLRRSAPDIAFRYVDPAAGRDDPPAQRRREFWPLLVIAVVGVLLLEQTLACWFGRTS